MSNNTLNLRFILESNKLNEKNFVEWFRNLKIVFKTEKIAHVLENPPPQVPEEGASRANVAAYEKLKESYDLAQCIMLASMTSEFQKQCENMDTFAIVAHLKELFEAESCTERFSVSKELFRCKMMERSSVANHGLKMLGLINRLKDLGFHMDDELSVDLILQSLPDSFSQFVMNFHMNKIQVPLTELVNMLKTAEESIKREKGMAMLLDSSKTKKRSKASLKKASYKKVKEGGVKKCKAKGKGTCHSIY